MPVLQFTPRVKRRSTVVQVLKEMLAEAEAGKLDGFGACKRYMDGQEFIVVAGYFEANPAEALRACLDASIVLNNIRDAAEGGMAASSF
jgi:hypothetical protein